jgi:hypothetical protein
MASTYTPNKNIEQPAYNDYAANPTGWTTPVNTDWSNIDLAFGGSTTLNMTGLSGTVTLTSAQYIPLSLIVTGTPTGLVTYRIPSGVGGQWIVRNTTTYTVNFVSAAGGGTVVVGSNSNVPISCDGTSSGMILTNFTAPVAAGSDTQVQYNSGGVLAGSSNLTFDGTTLTAAGLNAAGNVTLGSGAGSTLTVNPNTMTLGAGAINIGSSTLYLNSATQQVGIGTTAVTSNKLTVAGTIRSTAGGIVYPDGTTQTTATLIASGTVAAFAGASAPTGTVLCDGSSYSTTGIYANLFAVIGYTYGGSGGSFNVPDLRGRVIAMVSGASGRLGSGYTGGFTGTASLGASGGEQGHTQTYSELVSHAHGISSAGGYTGTNSGLGGTGGGGSLWQYTPAATGTDAAGGNQPFNVVQPTLILNYIIYL